MVNTKKFNKYIIRFRRRGHIHYPVYEVVLMKQKSRIRGPVIEKLGFCNLNPTERLFFINVPRLAYWTNKGTKVNIAVKKYILKLIQGYAYS